MNAIQYDEGRWNLGKDSSRQQRADGQKTRQLGAGENQRVDPHETRGEPWLEITTVPVAPAPSPEEVSAAIKALTEALFKREAPLLSAKRIVTVFEPAETLPQASIRYKSVWVQCGCGAWTDRPYSNSGTIITCSERCFHITMEKALRETAVRVASERVQALRL